MFHQPTNSTGNYSYNGYLYHRTMYKMHFHRNYELISVVKGEVWVKTAHLEKMLTEGEMLIVPPNEPHSFTVYENSSKVWVGVFSEDHIPAFSKKLRGVCFSPFFCPERVWSFLCDQLFLKPETDLFERIGCLYLACAACERYAEKLPSREEADLIFQILSYIDQHFRENLTLAEIAKALGYEYHYFSTLFYTYFSVHFREFLNTYRFEYACEQMEKREKNLTEIALESGFGSIRSFNRVFRKQSGKTPREYLKEKN